MERSTIHGLVFFGILFTSSLLLWPELFLRFLGPRHQLWVVRNWTDRRWARITMLLTSFVIALCSWLVFHVSSQSHGSERGPHRQDSRFLALMEADGRR